MLWFLDLYFYESSMWMNVCVSMSPRGFVFCFLFFFCVCVCVCLMFGYFCVFTLSYPGFCVFNPILSLFLFLFLDACLYLNERERECVIWVGGKVAKIWEKSGEGNHAQNILY